MRNGGTIKNGIWDADTEMKRRKPKCQLDAVAWRWATLREKLLGCTSGCIYSVSLSAGHLTLTRHGPVWDPTDRGLLLLSAFQGPGPAYLLLDGAEINSLPAENQWERRDLQDSVFPGIEVERSWDFQPSYKCIICFRCNLTGVIQLTAIMPLVWNEYRCVWGEESSIICFDKKKQKKHFDSPRLTEWILFVILLSLNQSPVKSLATLQLF